MIIGRGRRKKQGHVFVCTGTDCSSRTTYHSMQPKYKILHNGPICFHPLTLPVPQTDQITYF